MKKSLLFLALALVGCVGAKEGTYTTSIFNPAPPQIIQNEKCEDIPAVQVFQVLDDYALANVCKKREYSDDYSCLGMTVYVLKNKDELLYDDKIIEPKEGQCISFSGTYKYEAKSKVIKTVPKMKMIDAEISNPEYDRWLKEQEN